MKEFDHLPRPQHRHMVMVSLDFTLLVTSSLSPGTTKAACILLAPGGYLGLLLVCVCY